MMEKISFIGAGNMGEALIRGIIEAGLYPPDSITACDTRHERLSYLNSTYKINSTDDKREAISGSRVIVLAVKPQVLEEVAHEMTPFLKEGQILISILAGVSLEKLRGLFDKVKLIRVMPNTPALVLKGMSCICKDGVDKEYLSIAERILGSVGRAILVNEREIDAVTGLSGSGPAYCFLMIEALADGGVKMGLSRQVAMELAVQTMLGSASLISELKKHPGELKDMVASPGGTTIYGLHVLEMNGVRGAIMAAVEDATLRSRELGK